MKEVYIITYDHPHKRTEEIVFGLLMQGIKPELLLMPWEARKARRPLVDLAKPPSLSHPRDYCEHLGIKCSSFSDRHHFGFPVGSRFLVGGAGILSAKFVEKHEIINAHPGKIPLVRGLDALKWSIYYGYPIGSTLHVIDEQVDMGKVIKFQAIQLYSNDTIHSIAQRLYGLQIEQLVFAATCDDVRTHVPTEPAFEPHRRMGAVEEMVMMERLKERLRGING